MTDVETASPETDASEMPAAPRRLPRRRLVNPVLARELQSRMRSWRAPVILTTWLLVNAGIVWLVKSANEASASDPWGDPMRNSALGRGVFDWVLFVMMVVLFFLIPGQAAGAIAGERERQTLIPLQVTLLTTRQLVLGKILASSAFVLLLMVAAMPVLAVAYLIGGVRISEIITGLSAVLVSGVLLAAMTTAVSALTKRVQGAVVLSYLLVLALTVGPFIGYGVAAIIDSARGTDSTDPPEWILIPDPFVAVGDVAGDRFSGSVPSPWDGVWQLLHGDENDVVFTDVAVVNDAPAILIEPAEQFATTTVVQAGTVGGAVETTVVAESGVELVPADAPAPLLPDLIDRDFRGGVGFVDQGGFGPRRVTRGGPGVPYWVQSLTAQALIAAVLLFFADRRLRTPAEVER